MTDTFVPTWPWPFPHWDGEKFVMPADLLDPQARKEFFKKTPSKPDLSDVEEALL